LSSDLKPDDRRLLRTVGLIAAAIVATVVAVVVSSPLTCPLVDFDACGALPLCSRSYEDGPAGPSGSCVARLF
jgi:hypothetical protein